MLILGGCEFLMSRGKRPDILRSSLLSSLELSDTQVYEPYESSSEPLHIRANSLFLN